MTDQRPSGTELLGYSAAQVREAEEPLLACGVPLMQRAAGALAERIADLADDGDVLLLIGSGNNGGDALHAGALLALRGIHVHAGLLGSKSHEEGLTAAQDAGVAFVPADTLGEVAARVSVVVDGILGIGAHGALRGAARDAVAAVLPVIARDGGPKVVAVDLPSGIDPDTGEADDTVVLSADVTVTFGAYKAGLLREAASPYVGAVDLIDLGLGPSLAGVEPLVRILPHV